MADRFARAVVAGRWWIIGFWAVATAASLLVFPSYTDAGGGGGLKGILSAETPAVKAEKRSVEIFGFPLIARTVVVQRDPAGLSPYAQARTVVRAVAVDRGEAGDVAPLLGALPVTNTSGLFPGSREKNTTALTYLLFGPDASLGDRTRGAKAYADRFFTERDHVVGVTGSAPARAEQGDIIRASLPKVELATLIAIVVIVGLAFRSLVAPGVTVLTAAVAYVATLRVSGALAQLFDLPAPDELKPVVVALLLGVVTDYVVFFCSALRDDVEALGPDQVRAEHAAALRSISRSGPIVAVAGIAVTLGTATLLAAHSPFFRALGPALAFTVGVGLLVAITLVPALVAVLGRSMFWPSRPGGGAASSPGSHRAHRSPEHRRWPAPLVTRIVQRRQVAVGVVVACTVGLLIAASPVLRLDLGVGFVSALPEEAPVRAAAASAQQGFSPGILSPTVVLVEGQGVARDRVALDALGDRLAALPGVAGVLGPGSQPLPESVGLLLAKNGDAARYLVVLDSEPLGADAVASVDRLQRRLPALLRSSGIQGTTEIAGDTATASFLVHQTESDLLRIAVVAMVANLLMLLVFLRAPLASLVLLATSLLSLSATLGITTAVFNHRDPGQGLTFYVPFAAAVLLLAFGSDYNIFTVGHVWDEARSRPVADAVRRALPPAVRAVAVAGLALAASFGLLGIVPLLPFHQLAFAVAVGIVLDVFLVRGIFVPALLTLLGPWATWPTRRAGSSGTG